MSRAATTTEIRLVPLAAVLRRLGISRQTWRRHWRDVFTDARTPGGHRRVYEDELDAAVETTGGPHRARAAVDMVRREMGRK